MGGEVEVGLCSPHGPTPTPSPLRTPSLGTPNGLYLTSEGQHRRRGKARSLVGLPVSAALMDEAELCRQARSPAGAGNDGTNKQSLLALTGLELPQRGSRTRL